MRNLAIKLSIISYAIITTAACTFGEDRLFPGMGNDQVVSSSAYDSAKPYSLGETGLDLGSTVFEPVKITDGKNTGTFVGQKVVAFRSELNNLQDAIKKHNADLQKVRKSVIVNAAEYHQNVSAVESKLQVGTTPGNPHVVASLQNAQNKISAMNDNAVAMNQLAMRVAADAEMSSYIISSIQASYAVSGAVDEDHKQLRILQNEAEKTNVVLNNILRETNEDYNRQQNYINTANRTTMSLEAPVRAGHFSGYGQGNAPVAITPMHGANASQVAFNNSNSPLMVIKFNSSKVNYTSGLNKAVEEVLMAKPSAMFEIVAVSPMDSSRDVRNNARIKATEVFQNVVKAGVSPEKVALSARSSNSAISPEVHIFVK